jgi:hypothetical protein
VDYTAKVNVYEVNHEANSYGDPRTELRVSSHRDRDMVVIHHSEGQDLTVVAADLIEAIERCSGGRQ